MQRVLLGVCSWVAALSGLAPATAAAQDGGSPAVPLEARLVLCASCHAADGNSVIPDNPVLAGQHATYLAQQLRDYKSGARKHPVMSVIIMQVAESEFDALAAFFAAQAPRPGAKANAKLAKRGQPLFEDGVEATGVPGCAGCHEDDGSGSPKYPRLAGQHAPYVLEQLKRYKSGERANDHRELMREVARRLTDAQMREVAAYVQSLGGTGK